MKRLAIFLLISGLTLIACTAQVAQVPDTATASLTVQAPPTTTWTPQPTSTATLTSMPSVTTTPTVIPTATWTYFEKGEVTVPILLYHHIVDSDTLGRYAVSPENFAAQMQQLYDWGYTTITISEMVDVLLHGGTLPPRPVVITFDDGNQSIYDHAYPIMAQYGFVGVNYIVAETIYLESEITMGIDELVELSEAGWEVGSHTYTHPDLSTITENEDIRQEIALSKLELEAVLDVPVNTIAYPFGIVTPLAAQKASSYGYLAGVGLGTDVTHGWSSLFYLSREEVFYTDTLEDFAAKLPWTGLP